MTPGQRRFGRRALIVGGTAAVAFEALRLWDNEGVSAPGATTEPGPEQAYNGSEQTVDLTVRWRHLERRVETATLLAAWHFDEGTGYAFDDVSGNGHPLYITGSSWNTTDSGLAGAIHRSGLRGGAVYLNGTRWLAADLTSDLTVPAGLSFSCWLRVTTLPRETALLVGLGSTASLVLDAAGSLTLTVTDDNAVPHVVRTAGGALTPGGWTQVTATGRPRERRGAPLPRRQPGGRHHHQPVHDGDRRCVAGPRAAVHRRPRRGNDPWRRAHRRRGAAAVRRRPAHGLHPDQRVHRHCSRGLHAVQGQRADPASRARLHAADRQVR